MIFNLHSNIKNPDIQILMTASLQKKIFDICTMTLRRKFNY